MREGMADLTSKKKHLAELLKKNPKWTAASVVAVLLSAVFPSQYFQLVLLVLFFGGGLLFGYLFLSGDLLPNLLLSRVRKVAKENGCEDELSLVKKICPVCGKQRCPRHRPELNVLALQPWKNVKLPKSVNDALEEFFNLVLKEFVYSWYKDLSQDEAFVDEIRTSFRFIASVLFRRLQKVDIPKLVTNKVLNAAMNHLHVSLRATRAAGPGCSMEQVVLDAYGHRLHCAAHNRRAELDYLKQLSSHIFPYVLPPHSLKCKSLCALLREILSGAILLPAMDVLADPDKLNNLLLLFLDQTRSPESTDLPSPMVPIFEGYSHPVNNKSHASLHLKLADILAEPDVLFPFMQFMKAEASVNVLQFYLSIEEFNTRILTPELSQSELAELHQQLTGLYKMYIDSASIDSIRLDDDIVTQIRAVCDDTPEGVLRLQTSTPLFRAYDHAYDLLEHTFLPLFHQSDEYYTMLCGERLPTKLIRSQSKSIKRATDALSLAKLGSRIKCVFKSNTVEGRPLCDDIEYAVEDSDFTTVDQPETPSPSLMLNDVPLRNLSAWRVTIPEVKVKVDPENPKKTIFVFIIHIRRVDVLEKLREKMKRRQLAQLDYDDDENDDSEPSDWKIDRRYNEFYVLEQKLAEFHGDLDDIVLPSKKTFATKNKAFFESQREGFEMYLQKLLTKPVLRGSELVYSFLRSEQEFTTGFLDVNLGKRVKSGAMKLLKERGQHLEPFLKSLLLSTENPKARPGQWQEKDADAISISSEKMCNSLYNNNANIDLQRPPGASNPDAPREGGSEGVEHNDGPSMEHLTSVYDTILYLVFHVYLAPVWLLRLFLLFRILIRNTVDTYLDWYLGHRLERVLTEQRVVKIIHLLRDALFFDSDLPRTDEEHKARHDTALQELKDYIPWVFVQSIGAASHKAGTELIFEFLQQPRLNKQLSYVLLDHVVEELFPELVSSDDAPLHKRLTEVPSLINDPQHIQ